MRDYSSVQSISMNGLCCGCGACVTQCHKNAISIKENIGGFLVAEVDLNICVGCGNCMKVCPSCSDNIRIMDLKTKIHGSCLEGFIGYATSKRIRYEGQSGGLVTGVLGFLFDSNLIDLAIATKYDYEKRRPTNVQIYNIEEAIQCCGSYYSQTTPFKTIIDSKEKRIAAIMLGCQAEAMKLMNEQGKVKKPQYIIGLMCAGQNSGHMIDELIKEAKIPSDEIIKEFRFRYSHPACSGWPGDVLIKTDKHSYRMNEEKRHKLKSYCSSYRCKLCYDQMCDNADLVFGDPWGISGDHSLGETVVIARTDRGLELLNNAKKAGYLHLEKISVNSIMDGETVDSNHLRKVVTGYEYTHKRGLPYPYIIDNISELQKKFHINSFEMKSLEYARMRMQANTEDEYQRAIEQTRSLNLKRDNQYRMQRILMLPIRAIHYFSKRQLNTSIYKLIIFLYNEGNIKGK